MNQSNYYKIKMVKMGKWALLPSDSETWHGENTSQYFKRLFGIPKGILALHTMDDGYEHMYVPESYFMLLFRRIDAITRKDYRGLEKKLKTFYVLLPKARLAVRQAGRLKLNALTNRQLLKAYNQNRDWAQHLTAFDQFTWIGEEYWTPLLKRILQKRLGLTPESAEYNEALFALTKPESISSTLAEKKNAVSQALKVKQGKTTLQAASARLARQFGWMPVFTYGDAWTAEHYAEELRELTKRSADELRKESAKLKSYSRIRNQELTEIVKRYSIDKKDLQTFVDFGLAIDTRNEAEYFVSYAGFYLVPIVKEIARRLFLSPKQVRTMTQEQINEALLGERRAMDIINTTGKVKGWGFDKQMLHRYDFTPREAEKLYRYLEAHVQNIQGNTEGQGTCASPGKVTGRARIVPSPADNYKVKDGDILITYATTTDYLPAMKRAAAIITEVGGLTCHAAVVSREFGIPCIVALKDAMRNFQDGQTIEVDATLGIVKTL